MITKQDEAMQTSHTFGSIFRISQATPLIFIALPMLIIIILRRRFYPLLEKWGYTLTKTEIVVDEDLPNFFQAVKLSDADWMVFENQNLRKNYGFGFI